MADTERKLTTILAVDVVGFSEMMGRDEPGTLAALKARRAVIEESIREHNGRVFGGAGDSLIAEFSSPLQAVICANDFQKHIAQRNQEHSEDQRMWFRAGINLGDVMVDGDNLYGDGVNIAARLEQIGEPGGVCVSNKVFEEVRRNLGLPFVDGGVRELKNISEPITVHHVRPVTEPAAGTLGGEASPPQDTGERARGAGASPDKQSICVHEFKVTGDEETAFLADGLRDGLIGNLGKYAAINLVTDDQHRRARPDFSLEGNVRGRGDRVRLSFDLIETATGSQVWGERYDRQGRDAFELEDEISEAVASVVRVKLKTLAFERLKDARNEDLSVPDLLSKAAGYFVATTGNNDEIEVILRLAIDKAPNNSMATAMLGMCLYRLHEFSPLSLPDAVAREITTSVERGVALSPDSYFAHLIAALAAQDIGEDFERALIHGQSALESNPNFTQAAAMVGIARCHLGQLEEGLSALRRAIEANKEDPHRFRHNRELAIALFVADELKDALGVSARLVELAPELDRNKLVHAALQWHAGREEKAIATAHALAEKYPGLSIGTMRPVRFGSIEVANRFNAAFAAIGLAPASNVVSIEKTG
jgi:adenylate cyclase